MHYSTDWFWDSAVSEEPISGNLHSTVQCSPLPDDGVGESEAGAGRGNATWIEGETWYVHSSSSLSDMVWISLVTGSSV